MTKSNKLTILIFPCLLLLSALLYYFRFTDYPLFADESLLLIAAVLATSLLLGIALLFAGWVWRVILLTFVFTLALSFLPSFQNDGIFKAAFFVGLLAAIFAQRDFPLIASVMAVIFSLGLFVFPIVHPLFAPTEEITQSTANDLPPILHIILDEHVGLSAIPQEIAGGKELQVKLTNFYQRQGFRIYQNAYSRYARTYNSIPNLLNFKPRAEDNFYFPGIQADDAQILYENAYFKKLSELGYQIAVYQSTYLNYCQAKRVNFTSCYTYPVHNVKRLKSLPIDTQQKFDFLAKSFILSSKLYHQLVYVYEFQLRPFSRRMHVSLPAWPWYQDQVSTISAMDLFSKLQQDLLAQARGKVFFVHLLLPHSPYIYNENCEVVDKVENWQVHYSLGEIINTTESRQRRYQQYFNQIQCTHSRLQDLLTSLKVAGIDKDLTIIIHGDHSSRLVTRMPVAGNEKFLDWQNFQDAYSTLFLIKSSQYSAGVDKDYLPLDVLLAQFSQRLTKQTIAVDQREPYVFLTPKHPMSGAVMPEFPLSAFNNNESSHVFN